MMMTQIGLTVFHYDHEHDIYRATAYTFHLRPQALGDINQSFIFKASSLNFLCKHNFDYNKVRTHCLCSCLNFDTTLPGGTKEHIFTQYKMNQHPPSVHIDNLNYSTDYNAVFSYAGQNTFRSLQLPQFLYHFTGWSKRAYLYKV